MTDPRTASTPAISETMVAMAQDPSVIEDTVHVTRNPVLAEGAV